MKNLFGIFIIVGLVVAAYFIYSSPKTGILKDSLAAKEPIINLTPTPVLSETENGEVHSADGSMKLFMKRIKTAGSSTYTFSVSGKEINNPSIFIRTLINGEMSLPANSWSPDNKHFFIAENDGVSDNYLIFKATGEAFADGAAYIDFKSHYALKMKEFTLRDVTGWDAPDLLHVRTSGPAFWFELGSNAFYRLVQR